MNHAPIRALALTPRHQHRTIRIQGDTATYRIDRITKTHDYVYLRLTEPQHGRRQEIMLAPTTIVEVQP